MKHFVLTALLLLVHLVASQNLFLALTNDRYDLPVIIPKESWAKPGVFIQPPASNTNSTDFFRNERIAINSIYALQWSWTNVTKNYTWEWDLWLVNDQWEKWKIFSPNRSQLNMSGYLWQVKNDSFIATDKMYFFYIRRRIGFWAEGFPSRFVNITEPPIVAAMKNSGGRVGGMNGVIGVSLLVALGFVTVL